MKTIIFDMDGVIVDSEPLHAELELEILEELVGISDREEHLKFIGTTDAYQWSYYKDRYGISQSIEELIDLKKQVFMDNIHRLKLIAGFKEFLELLIENKYRLALASSNNRQIIDKILDIFELEDYFKVSISGEEVEKGKPDPEIFLKAAKELSSPIESCIVIEDSLNGLRAAKASNMKAIGLHSNSLVRMDLSLADLEVESLSEISLEDLENLLA